MALDDADPADGASWPWLALAVLAVAGAPLLGLAVATTVPAALGPGALPLALAGDLHGHGDDGHGARGDHGFHGFPKPDVALGGPYDGPVDAAGVRAACPGSAAAAVPCYTEVLLRLLAARGSEAAFDVLDAMSRDDMALNLASHPIAHDLGKYALVVYGNISEALRTCSYKVFQGCIHGALEAYFLGLDRIRPADVSDVCPTDNLYRAYVCLHGLGHGLMLATRYGLNESLTLCDALPDGYAQGSCHGGVFMENFVGYRESKEPAAAAAHAHGPKPDRYWIEPSNPSFPCDAIAYKHRWACWFFHTSVVLYFNGGNFAKATEVCAALDASLLQACFRSLGRDLSVYKNRDPSLAGPVCLKAPAAGHGACVRGLVADSILFYATPDAGIPVCRGLAEALKADCYDEVGLQGRSMAGDRMAEVCAAAEPAHVEGCRRAAGVA